LAQVCMRHVVRQKSWPSFESQQMELQAVFAVDLWNSLP